MEYTIRFVDNDNEITVREGTILSEAIRQAGIYLDSPCGGKGSCGKCTVDIAGADGERRSVLACRTAVQAPLSVWLKQRQDERINVLTDSAADCETIADPRIVCRKINVQPCVIGEKASMAEKFAEALGTEFEADLITAAQLSDIGSGEMYVVSSPDRTIEISAQRPVIYTAAFDIGTTTIAGYLLDENGKITAKAGALNPQTEFGADVISRVEYTTTHGTDRLTNIVRRAINDLLGEMCNKSGIDRTSIYAISIVGNTCMHHLFLGLKTVSLGKAPFSPVIRKTIIRKASEFGIEAVPNAELIMVPVIAGFIGADTIGCAIATDLDKADRKTLLIDIGTNGELIMGTKERMIACSTAAGPAFEGAKISMGMRGVNGAIDHVRIDEQGKICAHVIGEGEARGICGSGLVDAVSVFLKEEIIDETGRYEDDEYCFEGTQVTITQKDIREIQLAKAAIHAGIRLMAAQLKWELDDIEQVLIAGAFGNYMDPDSACDIGLIPQELRGKIRGIGNAAGEGAKRILTDRNTLERAASLSNKIEFLELATLKEFQDTFVDALSFGDEEE